MADDLPSWATKGKTTSAVQSKAADASLPSWAGAKKSTPAVLNGGSVVVASTPESHPGFFSRLGSNLKDVAYHAPGGVVALGKAIVHDEVQALSGKGVGHDSTDIFINQGKQTLHDLRHPLRNPGYSALDILALGGSGAGSVARVGAASKAVTAAGDVGLSAKAVAAGRAITTRPSQGVRTFTHDGVPAVTSGSRNALIRASQRKMLDPLRHHFKDAPVIGSAATVGRLTRKAERYAKRQTDAEAGAFFGHARAAGMLKRDKTGRVSKDALARQHVIRVVAEGVPIEDRVATHETYLERGYTASAKVNPEIAAFRGENFTKGHNEQIALNQAASEYVHNVKNHEGNLVPRIKPEHKDLIEAYQQGMKLAGSREALLERVGELKTATKEGRYAAPGREFFYANTDKSPAGVAAQIRKLEGLQAARHVEGRSQHVAKYSEGGVERKLNALRAELGELKANASAFQGGEMRVPTVPKGKMPRSKADRPQVGAQGVVNGVPSQIASLYKPYLGKAYKAGAIRTDVVRLMHESWQEAQRYSTLLHVTDRLKSASKDFKTSKHDILIKVDEIPGQLSMKDAKAIAEDTHADASKIAELAYRYESVRQQVFPDSVGGASKHSPLGETPPPGYKWVDSRLLGGLNHRNPLLGFYDNKSVMGVLKVTDAINNASKLAILYMKPAYIASNVVGNTFMVLTHQGFAAPVNLKRAARLNAETDVATAARVDAAIGEGVASVLDAGNQGLTGKAVHVASKAASKVVDLLPRRAAFLHEASKEGFRGSNLHQLFEPQNSEKLQIVTERMNNAMIDYGDLSPFEQAIVRRVIFFYPWVKGATKWSVRYVGEHPLQAAAAGDLAQVGKQNQQDALGPDLPSWAQGLIPAGAGKTTNPSSIGILNTPVDLLQSVLNGKVSDNLPPGVGLATGYRHPIRAVKDQVQSFPIVPVADVALHAAGVNSHLARPSKTFPNERGAYEAILLWLLSSGLAPRVTSPDALARSAYFEKRPPHG